VVTGTLGQGRIAPGDALQLLPAGRRVAVRSVQVHGTTATEAVAGQRTALNLSSVEVSDIRRGDVLTEPGTMKAASILDAWIEVLDTAPALEHGARVRLHQGTTEVLARVAIVAPPPEDPDLTPAIEPGSRGFARLRLERPAVVTRRDRFVLRAYSPVTTIGGGIVLDPDAPRGGVRLAETLQRLERLLGPVVDGRDEREAQAVMVADAGRAGMPEEDLVSRAGVAPAALASTRRALVDAGLALDVEGRLVAPQWRQVSADRVLTALTAHHEASPLSEGLSREQVREGVLRGVAPGLVTLVLDELQIAGRIVGRDRLSLAGRVVELSGEERQVSEKVESHLREKGLTPPDTAQLPGAIGSPPAIVERVLHLLVRQKRVVRLEGLPYHRDTLDRLRSEVTGLKEGGGDTYVDVASFKSRYGLTRKFAIPLLEYLDRERVTRRVGERRLVL
jgi:selenocysteine-specific elongation factor